VQPTTDTGGGYNIGYITAGEWLEYKVTLPADGIYFVNLRVASATGGGLIQVSAGTAPLTMTTVDTAVSATGGWQTWTTLDSINLGYLLKGETTIRIDFLAGDFNLNWFALFHTPFEDPKAFERVRWLPENHRQGILTHASILTSRSDNRNSNPGLRATWVSDKILCNGLPSEPGGESRMLFDRATGPDVTDLSTRQFLEKLDMGNPQCAVCHDVLYPLGFGLENYDAIGQWRTEETRGITAPGPWPIDATGKLITGEMFNGAIELSNVLANSSRLPLCVANTMMTYAIGRDVAGFNVGGTEGPEYTKINDIYTKTMANGNRFQDMVKEIVLSDAFRKRAGADSFVGGAQ
jgi:Protein of unknown function (DUF1588)/Carbohydrate binding module (family 6)/Protein of unknown function (DUF1585)